MGRLKGLGSFLLITGAVFLVLRLLHVAIPLLHSGGPTGPVFLDSLDSVAQYTDFSPRIPSYWPEQLGARPDRITVTRRPHPSVEIVWSAERSIRIREQRSGPVPAYPATAEPFPGHPGSFWWREGDSHRVVLKQDGLWIEVWTDLSIGDLQRVLHSLRTY
jgi:hypothetical protein